jgi:hypothetical protein
LITTGVIQMADKVELTAASGKDEVAAYVEEVVAEVAAERAGEKPGKSDAQIVAEQSTAKKPPESPDKTPTAEKPSGDDDTAEVEAEAKGQGDETGKEEASWLDDDLKAEVAANGIDEKELADFASREELERALRLFDKSALDAGRKALAESADKEKTPEPEEATGRARGEDGKFLPKEGKAKEGRYEVSLKGEDDPEGFDNRLVAELGKMRDYYESRLEVLESRFQAAESRFLEADARAEEERFDTLVDSLGHADLFGKTGSENPKELQRRQDLIVAVKAQQIGLERLGRPTELNESLVNRVARMVFAEDLAKKDLKQRTRKISKQSNGRQGGGVTRPQDPREDPRAEADRLYRELERA